MIHQRTFNFCVFQNVWVGVRLASRRQQPWSATPAFPAMARSPLSRDQVVKASNILCNNIQVSHKISKEGVFLRHVSSSVGLSDHFPSSGILIYRSDRDWSLRVCYFWGAENRCSWHYMSTSITSQMVSPRIEHNALTSIVSFNLPFFRLQELCTIRFVIIH